MKIADTKVTPITIPIHSTIEFTQGRIPYFQRLIIEVITDEGIVGYGECRGDGLRYTAMKSLSHTVAGLDPYHLERFRWMIAPQGLVDLFQGSVAAHINYALEMA